MYAALEVPQIPFRNLNGVAFFGRRGLRDQRG